MSVLEKTAPEDTSAEELVRDERLTVIRPATRMPHLNLRELWQFRELSATFVWRDLKVRYKQTFIGVVWVLLQPILATVIFTLIFGKYADFPSDDLPYEVLAFSGVLLWTYFASGFSGASSSIAGNKALVTRVYFPRLLLPLGAIATPLVDFLVVFPVLVGMIFWYEIPVGIEVLAAPFFVLLAAVTAFGAGLLFAVANVRYRDIPYALPFVINMWFWVSPVAYSVNGLEERYQWLASLNPMTGAITGLRWSLLGSPLPWQTVVVGTVMSGVVILAGLAFFRHAEPRFADTI